MWVNSHVYIIKVPYYGLKLLNFWPLTFLLLWVNLLRPLLREISGGGGEISPPPQGTCVTWDVRVRRVKNLILLLNKRVSFVLESVVIVTMDPSELSCIER